MIYKKNEKIVIFFFTLSQKSCIKGSSTRDMAEEKTFENKIKRYLESVGVYALGTDYRNKPVPAVGYYEKRWGGGMFTKAGLPDMHICIHGHSIELEIKAERGRLSEIQKTMLHQINASGGYALVVYPKDFEALKQNIERFL